MSSKVSHRPNFSPAYIYSPFQYYSTRIYVLTPFQFGRMVLQGPTYAMEEPKACMQRGNSKKHDIRTVTEEFIAYCVTQVCTHSIFSFPSFLFESRAFSLQVRIAVSGKGYVELDGLFHNATLFSTVIALIRLNPAKKKVIFAFWNM